jgi:uncharacterized membrane protein YedE/YeeE
MTPKLLLRIAAVLILIHLIGHSIGHSSWKKNTDPAKIPVIRLMTGPKFPFMGVNRSMGDYFDGYGYIASVTLALLVVLLWLSSNHTADRNPFVHQTILILGLILVAIGLLEFTFFFPFAACISSLSGILAISAWFLSGRALATHAYPNAQHTQP